MTTAPTTATTAALLAELTSIGDAVREGGLASAEMGLLDATDSPLSALSAAGFGDLRQLVSFLEEPLTQLAGDSGSVSSAARDFQGSGETLATLAESYRASGVDETSTWSGGAAEAYRGVAAKHADGIAALGQAAVTVGSAISAAGGAVAQTIQGVRQDITEAVGQMLPIMTQARARAAATYGASVAEGLTLCVRIAEEYGRRIAARMRDLLSRARKLKGTVEKTMHRVDAVEQALHQTDDAGTAGESAGGDGSASGTDGPGGEQSDSSPADAVAGMANQTSSDRTSQSVFGGPSIAESLGAGTTGGTSSSGSAARLGGSPLGSTPATVTPQSLDSGTSLAGGLSRMPAGTGGSAAPGAGPRRGASAGLPGAGADGRAAGAGTTGGSASSAANRMLGGGMMGAPAGGRAEDKEHRAPEWLREPSGLFDSDAPVAPAIIDAPLSPEDDDMPGDAPPVEPQPLAAPRESATPPAKVVWRLDENGELKPTSAPQDR
jgi:uncharacterized protein YukE